MTPRRVPAKAAALPYDLYLLVALNGPCNLDCGYCFFHVTRGRRQEPVNKLDIPALLRTLDRTGKKVNVAFSGGGEPALIANLPEACAAITKRHYVSFNTNLVAPGVRQLFAKLKPARVPFVIATFHGGELEKRGLTGRYIENFRALRRRGFKMYAVAVAHPSLLKEKNGPRETLAAEGIGLIFLPYIGKAGKKNYPAAYTELELDFFNIREACARMRQHGKLCNAGYNACYVLDPGGGAVVCPQVPRGLGSMYKGLKLSSKMTVCPAPFCMCPIKYDLPQLFESALRETGSKGTL